MKLATLKTGTRDGQLVVVNRAMTQCASVPDIAHTMQSALDRWSEVESQLRRVAGSLEAGELPCVQAFDPKRCAAPLPRAYHWVDGSVYLHHVELVRRARGAQMPNSFLTDPLVYQGGSDDLLGPCDDACFVSEEDGIDLEAEVAVVTDDVPIGTTSGAAAAHVKLVMLVNDWTLRNLVPGELAKGFGFYQSKTRDPRSPPLL